MYTITAEIGEKFYHKEILGRAAAWSEYRKIREGLQLITKGANIFRLSLVDSEGYIIIQSVA